MYSTHERNVVNKYVNSELLPFVELYRKIKTEALKINNKYCDMISTYNNMLNKKTHSQNNKNFIIESLKLHRTFLIDKLSHDIRSQLKDYKLIKSHNCYQFEEIKINDVNNKNLRNKIQDCEIMILILIKNLDIKNQHYLKSSFNIVIKFDYNHIFNIILNTDIDKQIRDLLNNYFIVLPEKTPSELIHELKHKKIKLITNVPNLEFIDDFNKDVFNDFLSIWCSESNKMIGEYSFFDTLNILTYFFNVCENNYSDYVYLDECKLMITFAAIWFIKNQ